MATQEQVQDLQLKNEIALQTLRDRFAGLGNVDISLSRFDWRALMESGALAKLHVSRYRGTRALTADDLGLSQEDMKEVEGILALGQRLILPKEILGKFNSVETRARQKLRGYILQTPAGAFLPASAYASASAAMQESKAVFDDLVASLLDRLPEHEATMKARYATLADQVYARLQDQRLIGLGVYRDEFTASFVDRCMESFPSSETLQASFDFSLRLEFIPLPYQDGQTASPNYAGATDDLLELRKAVLRDQEQARQELVTGFVTSVQGELFGLVNEALQDVLGAIKTGGNLQSRSVVQLKGVVEKLGQLNFWQDKRLELIQQEIMALLDRPKGGKRDSDMDRAILQELQTQAKVVLMQLERGIDGGINLAGAKVELQESRAKDSAIKLPAGILQAPATNGNATGNRGSKLF